MENSPASAQSRPAQSQSLYRKYRPRSFAPNELVGQEHIARTIQNAIVLDRVAHAYLFCGPRGTGKTSTARLLAKAVNCQHPDPNERPCNECAPCEAINSGSVVDIVEIDAASNRGVDDIRDLREKVRYAPSQLAVKFYIIDEAHQLTRDAFNAFLKTLEEPPPHVKFVLATTEADKLPDTVASRCQRFEFRRIALDSMVRRLRLICDAEEIETDDEALEMIARHATGSLRDAEGLLDQLALYGDSTDGKRTVNADSVRLVLGLSRNDRLSGLVDAIAAQDAGQGLRLVAEATETGEDIHQLNRQIVGYLRSLLYLRAGGTAEVSDDEAQRQSQLFDLSQLAELVRVFSEVDAASNKSSYPQLPLEMAIVEAIVGRPQQSAAPAPAAPAQRQPAPEPTRTPPPARAPERQVSRPEPSPPAPAPTRAAQSAPPEPKAVPSPEPAQQQRPQPQPAQANGGSDDSQLERLATEWVHIRRDVKVENSRIAALLSSVDPVAITAEEIFLAAPYEFHRNKLSEDNVRRVVETVIERYMGPGYRITCVAPNEAPTSSGTTAPAAQPAPSRPASPRAEEFPAPSAVPEDAGPPREQPESPDEYDELDVMPDAHKPQNGTVASQPDEPETSSDDERRIQAARSIFEARETKD